MGRLIDADGLKANVQGWYAFMREIKQIHMTLGEKDFIAKIDNAETVEAIPKSDYEARLKADMVDMLTEIKLEIVERAVGDVEYNALSTLELKHTCEVINKKIKELKENEMCLYHSFMQSNSTQNTIKGNNQCNNTDCPYSVTNCQGKDGYMNCELAKSQKIALNEKIDDENID